MLTPLVLSQDDLQKCGVTDLDFVGSTLLEMFKLHAKADFTQPPSVFLKRPECPHVADRIIGMGAHLGGQFAVEGMKWIASAHANPEKGLPRANAIIILNDAQTRVPICIMEGTLISAMRTAVVQGLACRYLGRADAEAVGLVGCGRIGGLILYVLRNWFPKLATYKVFDTSPQRMARFVEHMRGIDVPVETVSRFQHALEGADFGIVATTAERPYVPASCFKKGSLFLNVSLMDPLYELVLAADKLVVDDWVQSIHSNRVLARMYKEGLINDQNLHAELGEIVTGTKSGRSGDNERIFWNPFGMAIEDLAIATASYKRACAEGVGTRVQLRTQEWSVLF